MPLQCPPLVPPYYYCWAWRLGGRGVKALLLGPREFDRTLIDLVADGQAPLTCREHLVSAARQGKELGSGFVCDCRIGMSERDGAFDNLSFESSSRPCTRHLLPQLGDLALSRDALAFPK